jgi:murein DD-endopeptidase MepM/ murein hydrolase activator NlpD
LSAGRRRLRLAIPIAIAVVLVATGSVSGLAGVKPDIHLTAVRGALGGVRADIDLVHAVIDGLQGRVRGVEGDLGALQDLVTAADARLGSAERVLAKSREAATQVVTTGRSPGRPLVPRTLEDLRAPLQVVNDAIQANDQLAVALIDEQGDDERRIADARGLLADLRQASFLLEHQERVVRARLIEAIRSAHLLGTASADPGLQAEAEDLVTRAEAELYRIDVARSDLRARTVEVLDQTVALDERFAAVREGLKQTRLAGQALDTDMTLAELLVSSRLTTWDGGGFGDFTVAVSGILRVCPLDQPMSYSDNWHAPRWAGGFHLHQGIDMFAAPGTPIRAPFDGLSVTADNFLGGLAVKVYGETGYVYNAHLSAHGQLGPVKAGDIIGYVGSTGDASGPHLHFEYHPGNGDAVNPYAFLNAVC